MTADLLFIRREMLERITSLRDSESHFKTEGNEQAEANARNRRNELERFVTLIDATC